MTTNERVLVLGMGRSGRAAAELLRREGAALCLYDRDAALVAEAAAALGADVERATGDAPPAFDRFDRVVASPGLRLQADPRLEPEVDLAARHLTAPLIGVTGTNGKSTTVVLIGEMLRASGVRAPVGGNLGTALCELVGEPADWVVAELSSFQLEHAQRLHARIAVLLNLAPDHLDRHGSLQAYGAAKARLADLQSAEDTLIANADDEWCRAVTERAAAQTKLFSATRRLESGASRDGDDLLVTASRGDWRVPLDRLAPACRAHLSNALAALLAASEAGGERDAMRSVLEGFEGLPHRSQQVCSRRGVDYVNDSKATNPAAAAASVDAQRAPVWWLAGGRDKQLDFTPLARVTGTIRAAFVYGEAAPALEAALSERAEVVRTESLDEALQLAARRAEPGDVVLLSPACASFDQFDSFEARGDRFCELARALPC
ncbi:MAG: UDP-N-acetylmuramoyl-L-alanine--D-glutamate ligase [Deltaproteobacteria bacterium]|nr:UDP-N-acetylmuramoyl-L-alanine--D-glutamate ligase [Deltaproteobacteria bacterium]MBW2413394.1 UDP-N-acetylmuramoyl-L-alanine--D-glutamate ligase [Deltaproteobacteria bacterium]